MLFAQLLVLLAMSPAAVAWCGIEGTFTYAPPQPFWNWSINCSGTFNASDFLDFYAWSSSSAHMNINVMNQDGYDQYLEGTWWNLFQVTNIPNTEGYKGTVFLPCNFEYTGSMIFMLTWDQIQSSPITISVNHTWYGPYPLEMSFSQKLERVRI